MVLDEPVLLRNLDTRAMMRAQLRSLAWVGLEILVAVTRQAAMSGQFRRWHRVRRFGAG